MRGGEHQHQQRYELEPAPDRTVELGHVAVCAACAGEGSRLFRPGSPEDRPQLASPEDAAALLVPLLQGLDREHCLLASLDIKHRVLGVTTVSIGSDGHTFMAPREVFRDALAHGGGCPGFG